MVRENFPAVDLALADSGAMREADIPAERAAAVGRSQQSRLQFGRLGPRHAHLRSSYFMAPAGLGLASAVPLLGLSGPSAAGAVCAALVVLIATVLGHRLAIRHLRELDEAALERRDDPRMLREMCARIFPVWARQIETSRDTADDAVASLARTFSGMVERLEATLSASRSATSEIGAGDASIVATVGRSETDLANVVAILKELQEGKDAILSQVGEYATHLREMASDVQQIAMQIRLLALNGAIEAARAGEAGKAFAVVVGEMRRLAAQSADVGARISSKVQTVNAAVADMFRDTRESGSDEGASIQQAERDIGAVLERFKGLTTGLSHSVAVMESESEALKTQISDALVALQFQDRVSQIMSHLAQSVTSVGAAVAQDAEAKMSVESWLGEISRAFTTDEEFENLRSAERSTSRHKHEVTFF
jgi:methyl-accepting chemotaxis protein